MGENVGDFKDILIVGASRGLGSSVAFFAPQHLGEINITLISRRFGLESFEKNNENRYERHVLDMSKSDEQAKLCSLIEAKKFDGVIYCAGGGPYGPFDEKEWKDHQWALEVGLLAPMRLVLAWLKVRNPRLMGRFIIVGSRIAENSPDPMSASYAAGKHGILGFISSLQSELETNQNKVWLFSPGYMDTEMLPKSASVRHDGSKLMSADTAAQALLRWVKKEGPWHRVLS